MQVVALERPTRRRAFPHFVVESLRRLGQLAVADRRAIGEVPGFRQIGSADDAIVKFLDRFDVVSVASALIAHLHLPLVLSGRLDEQLAFAGIVAARLFDVDVLARLARENADDRVPVVAGRDRDRVDLLVVEDVAKIADGFRHRDAVLANHCRRLLRPRLVDVADVRYRDAR